MLTEAQNRFVETQRLASTGSGRCHGPCKRVLQIDEMISVSYQKTIAMTVCTPCFTELDLHMSMRTEGINIQLIKRSPIILTTR